METTAISSSDGEILVQLDPEHAPSEGYIEKIRAMLAEKFPDVQSFFRPADATSQTLASGAPTTFEVRLMGRDVPGNLALARELRERFAKVPGAVDVTLREVLDQPGYAIRIDRARAATFGINAQDAASALLAALGSGGSVAPNFWSDPGDRRVLRRAGHRAARPVSSPSSNCSISRSARPPAAVAGAAALLRHRHGKTLARQRQPDLLATDFHRRRQRLRPRPRQHHPGPGSHPRRSAEETQTRLTRSNSPARPR